MARMREISSPEKTVRPILITPPRSLRSKMRPAPTNMARMAILVMNMVLALELVVLKNRYSKIAHSNPAKIPKTQSDFCCISEK